MRIEAINVVKKRVGNKRNKKSEKEETQENMERVLEKCNRDEKRKM